MLMHRHPLTPGVLYKPSKAPTRRNPGQPDAMKLPAVADALGVSRKDARQAVEVGALASDRDHRGGIVVKAADLAKFQKQLEPVEVVEQPAEPAAAAGEDDRSATVAPAANGAAPAKTAPALVDEDADRGTGADDAGDEADYAEAECPSCGQALALAPGVLAVKCPGCGHRLRVEADEPERAPEARPAFFGLFSRRAD